MPQNKWLVILGVGGIGLIAAGFYFAQKQTSNVGAQNAINPNAQVGAGAFAQGTMPDIGNLLSYNQIPGATILTPQATSVDPSASNAGVTGG
jgi:hypothetical protein